ncbi:hypothetical protein ACFLU5_14730 [Bacteroidota bacterium]
MTVLFNRRWHLALVFQVLFFSLSLHGQTIDKSLFKALKPRSVGPAGMSGRVTAIDVRLTNPDIIYIGTASGGLWKSESGGIYWKPIFDENQVASIGALAIDQNNPDVIWVGTGEGNPRNSQTSGNGIYKSIDGGKTWHHLGLEDTRNIHRIILHRDNPDIAWAGVQGSAWGESSTRGVYKTMDGGKTWRKILYVNEKTGIADLVVDPENPNKLLAAMWEFRRWPWHFTSGGPGSGFYISFDGGESWDKRTDEDGLPSGELGRIGIAIAPGKTEIIYALIEAKKNGLYRSKDGGYKWEKVSEKNIGNRPFYYAELYIDPQNENRIYNLHSTVTISEDGGKTFSGLITWSAKPTDIHPDHHAWWVHPENPSFLINGNDGGLAISRDKGETWRFIENLPLAQFYHINFDMDIPYNIYGGMQDNGSWRGPAYVWKAGGIRNGYWQEVYFGDGFDVVPDPENSHFGYAMSQGGYLGRYDINTGHTQFIKPVHPDGTSLRFHWNAAIAQDPHDVSTVYYGSQFVHKSSNKGQTWEVISPDLTTNNPEKLNQLESGGLTYDVTTAENHCTILAISPSPLDKNIIWAGTDDGNIQLTLNGGETWNNLSKKIKDFPTAAWVAQIVPSIYDAGEAFVIVNNYRMDDWTPYLYYTKDYGKSWNNLVNSEKVWGYSLSIVQDPVEPNLLFLGTEFGLYFSLDKGESWQKWAEEYPSVSTMDLKIHPREHDLIIGTFGRAAYVIDDIRPIRRLASQRFTTMNESLFVCDPPDAYLSSIQQAAGTRFAGHGIYAGDNRPFGGMITLYLKELIFEEGENDEEKNSKKDSVWVEIYDKQDKQIRRMKVGVEKGFNRFTWDLCRKGERSPSQPKPKKEDISDPSGPFVLPGNYKIKVNYKDFTDSSSITVHTDPRRNFNMEGLVQVDKMYDELLALITATTKSVDQLNDIKYSIELVEKMLRDDDQAEIIKEKTKVACDTIKYFIELINPAKDIQGIRQNPDLISSRLSTTNNYLGTALDSPNDSHGIALEQAKSAVSDVLNKINTWIEDDWRNTEKMINEAGLSPFQNLEIIQIE